MRAPNAKLAAMQRLKQRGLKSALRPHVPAPASIKAPVSVPAHAPGRFVRAMAAPSVESDRPTKRKHSRRSGGARGAVEDGSDQSSNASRTKRSKKRKKKTSKRAESDDGAAVASSARSVEKKKKKKKKMPSGDGGGGGDGNGDGIRENIVDAAPARADGALDTSAAAASRRGAWVPRSRRVAPTAAAAAPTAAAAAPTTSRSAQAIASARVPPELTRRLKGLFNRLSENNAAPILADVAKLYSENAHGRAVTTRALTSAALSICAPHDVAPTGLAALASRGSGGAYSEMTAVKFVLQVQVVPTVAALVAALHFSVGAHVGAEVARTAFDAFAAALAARWSWGSDGPGGADGAAPALMSPKRNQNLLLLLVYLYSFGVLTKKLILDAVRKLIQRAPWAEADVELLLVALSHCGFALRRDDPRALGEIVKLITSKASAAVSAAATSDGDAALGNRMRYLVDMIVDLKNNRERAKTAQIRERIVRLTAWLAKVRLLFLLFASILLFVVLIYSFLLVYSLFVWLARCAPRRRFSAAAQAVAISTRSTSVGTTSPTPAARGVGGSSAPSGAAVSTGVTHTGRTRRMRAERGRATPTARRAVRRPPPPQRASPAPTSFCASPRCTA